MGRPVGQHGVFIEIQRLLRREAYIRILVPPLLIIPDAMERGRVEGLLRHRKLPFRALLLGLRAVQQRLPGNEILRLLRLKEGEIIGALQHPAVFQNVLQIDPDAGLMDLPLVKALVLHEPAVEFRGLPDVLRLLQRDPPSTDDMQAFHLLRLRHPALKAGEVKFRAQGQHA